MKGKRKHAKLNFALQFILLTLLTVVFSAGAARAATFTVTNANDSGAGSLRQAIVDANANLDFDTINFNIPGAGVHTINLLSPLPNIATGLTINGLSQPGAQCSSYPATLLIELNGAGAGTGLGANGLQSVTGVTTIQGLVINRFGNIGIAVRANDAQIRCNYIGTDPSGTIARPNGSAGIGVSGATGAPANLNSVIGGTAQGTRNLISGNGNFGVVLVNGNSNQVYGNYIGTNAAGDAALPNSKGGVFIASGSASNSIGNANDAAARNLISGNSMDGILIESSGNTVAGNYIGTNAAGDAALGNANAGIRFSSTATNNNIGVSFALGNVISGNGTSGILIQGGNNSVLNNFIGTNAAGNAAVGNASYGIFIVPVAASPRAADNNIIGAQFNGNTISGNASDGILIENANNTSIVNNLIGIAGGGSPLGNGNNGITILGGANNTIGIADSPSVNTIAYNHNIGVSIAANALNNRVLSNSIFANTNLGIDLDGNGVTPNDAGDADAGTNNLQNFPVISRAVNSTITASIDSDPTNSAYPIRVEFFADSACDSSGYGEGETFLGSTSVSAPGNFTFNYTPRSGRTFITATATDAGGNTSEFSQCAQEIPQITFTVTNTNDSGAGSLRQAIIDSNSSNSLNTIVFNIPGAGVRTINLVSPLPNITYPVTIDGATQPGAACPTASSAANLLIEINGAAAGATASGLVAFAGNTVFNGLVVNRFAVNGISLVSANNRVECSNIGTDPTGTIARPNGSVGIGVYRNGNIIGGATVQARNTVSGNNVVGVLFQGNPASGNTVQNNFIGVAANGAAALGNGEGVRFQDAPTNRVSENTIADNRGAGVNVAGAASVANYVNGNSIFGNGRLGIDLGDDGVTQNDANDADTGANNLQNYPVITSLSGSTVNYSVDSQPGASTYPLLIAFYASSTCDASGYGEGETLLFYNQIQNPGSYAAGFTPVAGKPFITATATDSVGNTSEFSRCASLAPTAASVSISGKVTTPEGRGLTGASVILTDQNGKARTARTTTFGYYRFDDVVAGETYILSVSSKRYSSVQQVVSVMEDLEDLNFTVQPRGKSGVDFP